MLQKEGITTNHANRLKTAAKIAISFTTLALVLHHSGPASVLNVMSKMSTQFILLAVSLFILSIYVSSIRWRILLPTNITALQSFKLYMVGSFYNTILPGAVSGDAVRAYYLYKNGCDPSISTASVFVDRYIGFIALFSIAAIAFPFAMPYLTSTILKLAFPAIALSFAASTTAIIRIRPGSKIRVVAEFYKHISHYLKSPAILFKAYLISLPVQVSSILITYVASKGLGMHISMMHLCAIIPVIATVTLIPISISGVGIREALFIMLLAPAGLNPAQATALSLASFLATVMGSLPGVFLTGHTKNPLTPQLKTNPTGQPM